MLFLKFALMGGAVGVRVAVSLAIPKSLISACCCADDELGLSACKFCSKPLLPSMVEDHEVWIALWTIYFHYIVCVVLV